MADCKYCGDTIKWSQEGGRWIPTDPTTGQSHQSVCAGGSAGGRVKLRKTPKKEGPGIEQIYQRLLTLEERVTALEGRGQGMVKMKFKQEGTQSE